MKSIILVVEDEVDIQNLIAYTLSAEGYEVLGAKTGEEAIKTLEQTHPDLILLDLMLPGIDGFEVCRRVKRAEKTEGIPVIMVTAKGEESDIVTGLELGAEDYITKPFSQKVLLARVRTVLRRQELSPPGADGVISAHELVIHPGRKEITYQGVTLEMTFSEFHILHFLAGRPGWVFTRNQIVEAVRGDDYPVTERAVDVQIVGIRKKLGAAAYLLETVRGVGYRFKE